MAPGAHWTAWAWLLMQGVGHLPWISPSPGPLCTSAWVPGADHRLIINEVAACRSQPANEWGLAWVPASLPCERLGRGLCGAVTRLALRWFKSPMRLKLRSCHGHADPGLTMTPQCSACTALVVTRQYPDLALPTTGFVCAHRVHPGEAARCTSGRCPPGERRHSEVIVRS